MIRLACACLLTTLAIHAAAAQAAKPKSPAEIAKASEQLAEKRETCRLQALEQKLSFTKRRKYIRDCVKR